MNARPRALRAALSVGCVPWDAGHRKSLRVIAATDGRAGEEDSREVCREAERSVVLHGLHPKTLKHLVGTEWSFWEGLSSGDKRARADPLPLPIRAIQTGNGEHLTAPATAPHHLEYCRPLQGQHPTWATHAPCLF